jgi:hypothetical protein
MAFLCDFWNKPIDKIPQCQFPISTVFVFQKSYTGNILEIGRNKFGNSYFSRIEDEDQTGAGEGLEAGYTTGGRSPAPGRPHPW